MKCITVKYLGPTTTKGARLAFYWGISKEYIGRDYSKSIEVQAREHIAAYYENVDVDMASAWDYKGNLQIIVS